MEKTPTQGDIADLIEFCSGGVFKVECGDPNAPFILKELTHADTPKAGEPGAQGILGEASLSRLSPEEREKIDGKDNS
jgi:hypothetical protein